MKKNVFFAIGLFLLIFLSCKDEKETKADFNMNENIDSLLVLDKICVEDKERIISYLDTIEFENEVNNIVFGNDTLTYNNASKRNYTLTSVNNQKINLQTINNEFKPDSMDLTIDLNTLEICYLKSNSKIIIIETKPMNWVGKMANLSLYTLIFKEKNTAIEVIK